MLTNRINTVTGVRYGDDPTILAWEVRACVCICLYASIRPRSRTVSMNMCACYDILRTDGQRAGIPLFVDPIHRRRHQGQWGFDIAVSFVSSYLSRHQALFLSACATQMMARQLVIDGRQGVDPQSLKCSHVDIVSKHYYPSDDGKRFRECLQEDLKVPCVLCILRRCVG